MTRSRDVSQLSENGGVAVPFNIAGKNKIINGDFGIWQRGTSFTGTVAGVPNYTADRWQYVQDGSASFTVSQQTFTPGTAPVAGYEGSYFYRVNKASAGSGQTFGNMFTRLEDARLLAGQTVTFSFWAKADASRITTPYIQQNFGTGGSSTASVSGLTSITLTTGWVRYSQTVTIPSLTGKTIGTNSNLELGFVIQLNTALTIDIWGVQLESGPVATPFTTATGTLQGELAACQRYYWRNVTGSTYGGIGLGWGTSTTNATFFLNNPVVMRITPTSVDYSTLGLSDAIAINSAITAVNIVATESTPYLVRLDTTSTGVVQYRPLVIRSFNNTSGYLGLSAEL